MICGWLANQKCLFSVELSIKNASLRVKKGKKFEDHTKDMRIRKEISPSTKLFLWKPFSEKWPDLTLEDSTSQNLSFYPHKRMIQFSYMLYIFYCFTIENYLFILFFFFIYCGLFVLILVAFVLFLLSLRFGQISPLAFFRWFTATSDRNAESYNRIPSNYCLP